MIFKDLIKQDEFAGHMVLCVLTAHAQDVANGDFRKVPGWENIDGRELDIILSIDGVEVPFQPAMERMAECREEWIKKEAFNLFQEKLSGKFPEIGDLLEQIEQKIRDVARETLGIELEEDY
ncbi:hypothetical protein LCGC14_0164280 [marine sediment metagenome]|uniref:Uncharacterized protein n=1 Tax=marine sediment metagenome TaxID=412755 RepID=A0A0F9UYJ6_9ZZZZ